MIASTVSHYKILQRPWHEAFGQLWKPECFNLKRQAHSLLLILVALLARCGTPTEAPRPLNRYPVGVEELHRLDLLARFKHSTRIGMFSSYDRTGGNDDGFNGTYSFVRKDSDGGLVLAELDGPGALYRIWTPTPTDDWFEFFIDGESEPRIRIRFRDLFSGSQPPFVSPIVGYGAGGFFCYLPIPFEKSIKVVARAEQIRFYQINYAIYPSGTELNSYDGYQSPEDSDHLESAGRVFGAAGEDLSENAAPPGDAIRTAAISASIQPGESQTLWSTNDGGRIVGLRLGRSDALSRKDRALVLKIYWEGDPEPAVLSPVGDFFGYSFAAPAARSMLLGTREDMSYSFFPMPFDRSARIELSHDGEHGPGVQVLGEVMYSEMPRAPDEGRFHALWRRENPTVAGQPYEFLNTSGRGHVVGAALQAQGATPANTRFFEGDDVAWIDGELTAHGTGSEDFFNGGWYNVIGRWMSRASFPLSGCLEYKNPLSRTGGYRFLLTDSYPFRQNIRLTIEHGPEGNRESTDYSSVAYWYSDEQPAVAPSLPPLSERAVQAPEKLVFRPGWSVPLDAFSFQGMTLAKRTRQIDGRPVRVMEVRAQGEDRFGLHSVAFRCELPEAGRYSVSIEALAGPEQATVQIFRNERAEGQSLDLYAPGRNLIGPTELAELEMMEGENVLLFKLTGRNPRSSGLGFDLASIVFERSEAEASLPER